MDAAALINSSINFIFYCVMSKQFRKTFVATFHLQWCVAHRPRCPSLLPLRWPRWCPCGCGCGCGAGGSVDGEDNDLDGASDGSAAAGVRGCCYSVMCYCCFCGCGKRRGHGGGLLFLGGRRSSDGSSEELSAAERRRRRKSSANSAPVTTYTRKTTEPIAQAPIPEEKAEEEPMLVGEEGEEIQRKAVAAVAVADGSTGRVDNLTQEGAGGSFGDTKV